MSWRWIAVAGCVLGSAMAANAQEKVTLAAGFGNIWTAAQPAFCRDRGEFAKAGIEVEIVPTRGGSETIQAVATKAADIGYGAAGTGILAAVNQGARIKIISGYFNGQSDTFYYVPKDSPVQTVKDFDGRSVAMSRPGSVSEQILTVLEQQEGIKINKVATGALDATFTMTMTGQVDVGYSIPPSILDRAEKGEVRVLFNGDTAESLKGVTARLNIANEDFLAEKPELAQKFVKVLDECIDWMYANIDEGAKMYADLNNVSVDIAKKSIEFYPRENMEFFPIRNFEKVVQDAIDLKFIEQAPPKEQLDALFETVDLSK